MGSVIRSRVGAEDIWKKSETREKKRGVRRDSLVEWGVLFGVM